MVGDNVIDDWIFCIGIIKWFDFVLVLQYIIVNVQYVMK